MSQRSVVRAGGKLLTWTEAIRKCAHKSDVNVKSSLFVSTERLRQARVAAAIRLLKLSGDLALLVIVCKICDYLLR